MKLKHNILAISAACLCGFSLVSCSDMLEIESLNEIVLENFWNEKSDVDNVVAGCYSALQSQSCIDRMMVWGECRSENMIGGTRISDDVNLENIFKENIKATNGYTTWVSFYSVINRCNTVLKYAPSVSEKDPKYTQSELHATQAEMSALRDLCYFYLIRTFRDVPYTKEAFVDDSQVMALPATKFNDVLDSLINDLEDVKDYAIKTYPTSEPEYQHGRITRDAISAMLCDMYLWKGNYNKCIEYADKVINSKKEEYKEKQEDGYVTSTSLINGFPLISDSYSSASNYYGQASTAIFGTGNSDESIFELIYEDNDNMLANSAVSSRYGNATYIQGYFAPSDLVSAEHDYPNSRNDVFEKNDIRPLENVNSVLGSSAYCISKYASSRTNVTLTASTASTSTSLYPKNYCHANWIIYRLSDVMLMKAEAMTQLLADDNNQESDMRPIFNIINAVNKRSYASNEMGDTLKYNTYASKSLLENLVFDERNRELMFEGKRWYDLVRRSLRDGNTTYLVDRVLRKGSSESSVVSSKLSSLDAIFWPYNYDEMKANGNLVQNPAFSSGTNDSYTTTK